MSKKLNKRIELLEQESKDNNAGGKFTPSIKWIPYAKAWAEIEFTRGSNRFKNYQYQAEMTHVITIRYRKDFDEEKRIGYQNRQFKILYIQNEDEANRFLKIHVTEEV